MKLFEYIWIRAAQRSGDIMDHSSFQSFFSSDSRMSDENSSLELRFDSWVLLNVIEDSELCLWSHLGWTSKRSQIRVVMMLQISRHSVMTLFPSSALCNAVFSVLFSKGWFTSADVSSDFICLSFVSCEPQFQTH